MTPFEQLMALHKKHQALSRLHVNDAPDRTLEEIQAVERVDEIEHLIYEAGRKAEDAVPWIKVEPINPKHRKIVAQYDIASDRRDRADNIKSALYFDIGLRSKAQAIVNDASHTLALLSDQRNPFERKGSKYATAREQAMKAHDAAQFKAKSEAVAKVTAEYADELKQAKAIVYRIQTRIDHARRQVENEILTLANNDISQFMDGAA